MATKVRLKFLGTRSLHAAPSPTNQKFGGNVESILIEASGAPPLLINAGFAINSFGDAQQKTFTQQKQGFLSHVFLSDFLWEHILGIPFFAPVHFKANTLHVHSPLDVSAAKQWVTDSCRLDFSPFDGLKSFRAQIKFEMPDTTGSQIGPWTVAPILTEHPFAPYPAAIWTFKHESGLKIAVSAHKITSITEQTRIANLLEDYSLLVQTAISEVALFPASVGRWTFAEAMKFCAKTNVKQVILQGFHPRLNDSEIETAEINCQKHQPTGANLFFARENHVIELETDMQNRSRKAG